jgi:hypothetical protein
VESLKQLPLGELLQLFDDVCEVMERMRAPENEGEEP